MDASLRDSSGSAHDGPGEGAGRGTSAPPSTSGDTMARSGPFEAPTGVLFVCLGNICRSPLAEGVFTHLSREAGLDDRFRIDSAGTGGWHAGEPPDPRSVEVAARHGIVLEGVARKTRPRDFHDFDLILAMDGEN